MISAPKSAPARALVLAAALLPALLLASCSTEDSTKPSTPPSMGKKPTANPGGEPGGASGGAATSLFTSPRKADGDLTIQIVTNGISPFWDPMVVGMKKAAADLNCKADWSGPQPPNVGEQKRMVEEAIAKNVDGIAISCIEAKASEPIIQAAIEKNIPVITFDSDSPGSKRLCYIGTSNYNAGKAAGEAAVKLLPGGGKFIGFVGNLDAPNGQERRKGFEDAIKGHNIELVDVLADEKDAARARRNVEDSIAKNGDKIQGFLGLFSYNGPAIVQAVTNQNLRSKYKIVCFDAEPVTLNELEKGTIDATVVQKPYDFGLLSTKLLFLINRKGWDAAKKEINIPDNGLYDTGVEVITPSTVADYKKHLASLGIKSS